MLDSSRAQHYSTSWRKRAFEIPIPHNGAVERAIGELKAELNEVSDTIGIWIEGADAVRGHVCASEPYVLRRQLPSSESLARLGALLDRVRRRTCLGGRTAA